MKRIHLAPWVIVSVVIGMALGVGYSHMTGNAEALCELPCDSGPV